MKDGPSVFTFRRMHPLPTGPKFGSMRVEISARHRDCRGQKNPREKSSAVGLLFYFKCKNATQDCVCVPFTTTH